MDLMRGLTQADGCAVDGTAATNQNPMAQMVNQLMNTAPGTSAMKGAQQHGMMMGHPHPGMAGPSLSSQFAQHQQHLNAIDQGIAQGMGISASAPSASAAFAPMHQQSVATGDAFLQEFEAERQRQHFGIHGGASGLLGPRGAPMGAASMGDEWISQFEKLKFGAGPYRPGNVMHDTFAQAFHQSMPRSQRWVNEFDQTPSARYGDMNSVWKAQQNLENGEAWANETAFLKEQDDAVNNALSNDLQSENKDGETNSSAVSGDVEATRQATSEMADILSKNPRFRNSEFLNFMKQVSSGDLIFQNNEVIANPNKPAESAKELSHEDFEKAWEEGANYYGDGSDSWANAGQKMENLFQKAWNNALNEVDYEYDNNVDEKFENALNRSEDEYVKWQQSISEYEAAWNQQNGTIERSLGEVEYKFMEENMFLKNESAFEEGMKLFNDGRLLEAIMAFEAVVNEDPSNSEAWRMLGVAHQERDEDLPAIACFQRAIEQDAFNLDAMLALGVSLVNEGYGMEALNMLKSWITNNPNFHGLKFEADEFSDGSLMDEVMQLMLKAATHAPTDPGVQEVLGVLYNISENYGAAAVAFRKAIDARPDDYSLWNKLGATLANGKKSEEALPAYHRAIELKPRYARGWQNLGIAHNILNNYFESARCFLKALDLNPNAEHVWNQLQWCLVHMRRFDLVPFVDNKDLEAFRKEFMF